MALAIGDQTATSGMSKAIYDQIQATLEPDLADLGEDALVPIRESWQKLAFAVATGVINHIVANMEIRNVQTRGTVNTTVNGSTGPAAPANHVHPVSVSGTAANVVFAQNNSGPGLVQ